MVELTKSKAYERRALQKYFYYIWVSGWESNFFRFSYAHSYNDVFKFSPTTQILGNRSSHRSQNESLNNAASSQPKLDGRRTWRDGYRQGFGQVQRVSAEHMWMGCTMGVGEVGLSRPSAPEPILIFPISFTIPFC